ncbi:MAG: ATP-dependent sacrificial sulfur transferase LarE [Lachnospiraceae bacterium]|jgi:uncharacterized protein|nr:ATP-dependent sacrificial sulfur transferase LarE [Lachnospiraceae bacterium]
MCDYSVKKEQLLLKINEYAGQNVIVAFSGGVDSTLLLKIACDMAKKEGTKVYAVSIQTRLHPMGEMEEAKKTCQELEAEHVVISIDELKEAGIMNNPVNRCYLCKKFLFSKIKDFASKLEISRILEGTNEDDLHVYRPGIKALKELGIKSPLAEAGLTKAEVRNLASEYGLKTASKPSAPCLATRFPYGTELAYEDMERVEKGEAYLKSFGLYNVRIRAYGKTARIEVDVASFAEVLAHKQDIITYLKELGFIYITLDLEGFRSGSMDVEINVSEACK